MLLTVERVNDSQRAQILSDLGYKEKSLQDDMERIRLWMKTQDHFPPSAHKESNEFHEAFLVKSKGNLERCKKKLDNYYSLRSRLPHLLCPMDPLDKAITATKDKWLIFGMEQLTSDGCLVTFISNPDYHPSYLISCTKRAIMLLEMWYRQGGIDAGNWFAYDARNVTLSMLAFPVDFLRDLLHYKKAGLPVKVKGIIFFNVSSYLPQTITHLFKLYSPKYQIYFYPDEKGLLNHFPLHLIPKDFGGKGKPMKELNDMCLECTIEHRALFLGPLMETTDEKRRLQPRDDDDVFNGYFRQLEID